jgi:hypothetical protein
MKLFMPADADHPQVDQYAPMSAAVDRTEVDHPTARTPVGIHGLTTLTVALVVFGLGALALVLF